MFQDSNESRETEVKSIETDNKEVNETEVKSIETDHKEIIEAKEMALKLHNSKNLSIINLAQIHFDNPNLFKSTDFPNFFKNLRQIVEVDPAEFYFKFTPCNSQVYFKSLIEINPFLNIDDLIYDALNNLHSQSNDSAELHLLKICFILKNKHFSRSVLIHIFENIVYSDFSSKNSIFYKYSILNQIIQQYYRSDYLVEQIAITEALGIEALRTEVPISLPSSSISNVANEVLESNLTDVPLNTMLESISTALSRTKPPSSEFTRKVDLSKDNTKVLSNIIWENSFYILEDNKNAFESNCILSLYATIISCTGKFFENRILKNILRNKGILSKIKELPSFNSFYDAVKAAEMAEIVKIENEISKL